MVEEVSSLIPLGLIDNGQKLGDIPRPFLILRLANAAQILHRIMDDVGGDEDEHLGAHIGLSGQAKEFS